MSYPDYMASCRQQEKPSFEGYTGNKVWKVRHEEYGAIDVFAPSKPAAIIAAAAVWKRRWQAYDFYTRCDVTFGGTEKR